MKYLDSDRGQEKSVHITYTSNNFLIEAIGLLYIRNIFMACEGGQDFFRGILFFKLENHGSGEGPRLIFWSLTDGKEKLVHITYK